MDTKWILKKKYEDGKFDKYKARLVVRGYTQVRGEDYHDTYAPVAMAVTLRLFLLLCTLYVLNIKQLDVRAAFLQADVEEDLYAWPPEGFCPDQPPDKNLVYKLKKAWYGLCQAPRQWNKHLHKFLISQGLQQGQADKCLYFAYGSSPQIRMMVLVVVDDLLVAYAPQQQQVYQHFLAAFKAFTDVKELGDAHVFAGITITRDYTMHQMKLSQTKYTSDLVETYRYGSADGVDTPAVKGLQLSVADCPTTDSEKAAMAKYPYREILGKLLYLSVMTRPDISFVVNMLARFANNPSRHAWSAMKHLLRYLRNTVSLGLILGRDLQQSTLRMYADASWAANLDNRHSTSGYGAMIYGSLIAWWSRNQYLLARSSFEAELIAIFGATSEGTWIVRLLKDFCLVTIIDLFGDNLTTLQQLKEHRITKRTRHIAIRFYSTVEYVQGGLLRLHHVSTHHNWSDMLTKAQDRETFIRHRNLFLG